MLGEPLNNYIEFMREPNATQAQKDAATSDLQNGMSAAKDLLAGFSDDVLKPIEEMKGPESVPTQDFFSAAVSSINFEVGDVSSLEQSSAKTSATACWTLSLSSS